MHIKFKRKGGFTAGISLGEAQDHVRLSGNDSYRMHDFHADGRNRILLRVRVSTIKIVRYAGLLLTYMSTVGWLCFYDIRDSS